MTEQPCAESKSRKEAGHGRKHGGFCSVRKVRSLPGEARAENPKPGMKDEEPGGGVLEQG